jgi:hypothetical protein
MVKVKGLRRFYLHYLLSYAIIIIQNQRRYSCREFAQSVAKGLLPEEALNAAEWLRKKAA